ncbi:hypothetical protein [Paenibacillus durus]|uniref:hypothetical protein n=1 Tax=Paenibacillus durus TaxID=44251 RepID=UPI0012DBF41E|nr:hypothetical protein [Paenibacillus durus]
MDAKKPAGASTFRRAVTGKQSLCNRDSLPCLTWRALRRCPLDAWSLARAHMRTDFWSLPLYAKKTPEPIRSPAALMAYEICALMLRRLFHAHSLFPEDTYPEQ